MGNIGIIIILLLMGILASFIVSMLLWFVCVKCFNTSDIKTAILSSVLFLFLSFHLTLTFSAQKAKSYVNDLSSITSTESVADMLDNIKSIPGFGDKIDIDLDEVDDQLQLRDSCDSLINEILTEISDYRNRRIFYSIGGIAVFFIIAIFLKGNISQGRNNISRHSCTDSSNARVGRSRRYNRERTYKRRF